jgi:rhodanese-related sulfurtransferase
LTTDVDSVNLRNFVLLARRGSLDPAGLASAGLRFDEEKGSGRETAMKKQRRGQQTRAEQGFTAKRRTESDNKGREMSDDAFPIEITCRDVQSRQTAGGDFLFLDCREPDEAAVARIEGTLLIPMSQLAERVGELEPHRGREIIVHCHLGGRSLRVARWLRQQGFEQAASLAGGIDQWSAEIDATIPRY